jgi:hypothetical protein
METRRMIMSMVLRIYTMLHCKRVCRLTVKFIYLSIYVYVYLKAVACDPYF